MRAAVVAGAIGVLAGAGADRADAATSKPSQLLISSDRGGRSPNAYDVVNADGSSLEQLPATSSARGWAPDGRNFALVDASGPSRDISVCILRDVSLASVAWSPRGRTIAIGVEPGPGLFYSYRVDDSAYRAA